MPDVHIFYEASEAMGLLKETAEEQGCFRGCLVFVVIGAVVGIIAGIVVGNIFLSNPQNPMPPVVSGALGALLGFIAGSVLGALVGLVWGKFATKKKLTEEEF
jgi:ABC-type nitrate/sulfonate/bicarbonate transport system permease component